MDSEEVAHLTDSERQDVTNAVFEIMAMMKSLDEKGVSFRCCLMAFLFTINSSFEVMGYSKRKVKDVFQNIINAYDEESGVEEEDKE